MRPKFALIRIVTSIVIFGVFIFLIRNSLLYDVKFQRNSIEQPGTFDGDGVNPIYDAFDRINSFLWKRAFSESQVSRDRFYQNLPLTTANLDRQSHLCKSLSGSIFVGLISKPDSFDQRNLIRSTLGKQVNRSNQRMLFFIGESTNETVNSLVAAEFAARQDIVRLAFVDNYYNLTLKTLSFLEYFNAYCDNFKFAIKLDDDVFVNWPGIEQFLLQRVAEERPTIYCKVLYKTRVIRDSSNKWYMDRKQFPASYYPDYCGGLRWFAAGHWPRNAQI